MIENNKQFKLTERIIISAILLSASIIVNLLFRTDLPIAGVPLLRISLNAPFLSFIAILFGPLYGGIAGLLSDLISFLLKPSQGYMWQLTVVAFLKYVSIGYIWFKIKDANFKIFNSIFLAFFISIGLMGVVNTVFLNYRPYSGYSLFLSGLGDKTAFSTSILIIVSLLVIVIHLSVYFLSKHSKDTLFFEKYLKIITALAPPNLIFTTLNTYILVKLFIIKSGLPFLLILAPRLVNSLATSLFSSYVIIILANVYNRYLHSKGD